MSKVSLKYQFSSEAEFGDRIENLLGSSGRFRVEFERSDLRLEVDFGLFNARQIADLAFDLIRATSTVHSFDLDFSCLRHFPFLVF